MRSETSSALTRAERTAPGYDHPCPSQPGSAAVSRTSEPVRVLVADDHRLFVEAMGAILAADARIEVVGAAANGEEAVELFRKLQPDVVLIDIAMPTLDGLEATRRIMELTPEARVLVLTGSEAASDVDAARKAGASGYVTKDRIASELIDAILVSARA